MKLPFSVVDADGHIIEDQASIKQYIEPPYGDVLIDRVPNSKGIVGHGNGLVDMVWADTTIGGRLGGLGSVGFPQPSDWLANMERGGMERVVLFPTTLGLYGRLYDPDYMTAVGRAYNNWIAEEWLRVSDRLRAVALVPLLHPQNSIKEMTRAITELGFSAVVVAAVGFGGLGNRSLDCFYEAAQGIECPIAVHGSALDQPQFTKFIQKHTAGFPMSMISQVTHMTYEGVFERYPKLRVAFLEAGCTWVPYLLNRMDEEWEKRGWLEAPECKKEPSEYFRNGQALFFHAEPNESLLPHVAEFLGDDHLLYASDWPHWDNEYPESIKVLWEHKGLNETTKKKILSDNARRLYRFE